MVPSEAAAATAEPPSLAAPAAAAEPRATADGETPLPPQERKQQQTEEHAGSPSDSVPATQQQAQHEEGQAQMGAAAADPAPESPAPPPPLAPPPPPTHRLKHVQLPGGRSVPVVMQSENGPCPLLAIANVLLLRGNIYLPPGASEVTQERLIALVAENLLDRNGEDSMAAGATDEFRANLARNVADAIDLLPKLATGVDVNVRFTGIDAFEFTDEVAIFDLLGMQLLHGWLVDPQDTTTAAVVGNSSYNEMLARLTTADLEPAQPQPSAQPVTAGGVAGTADAESALPTAETTEATAAVPRRVPRAEELAAEEAAGREDSFDRNLRAALALSLGQEPPQQSADTDAAGPSRTTEAGPSTAAADAPAAATEPASEDRIAEAGGPDAFDAVLVERPSDADMAAAADEIAAYQAAQAAGLTDPAGGEAAAAAGDASASADVPSSTDVNGAIVEDLVSVTAQLQLDDAASPVVADGAATAAAPESESDVTPPIDAAAEPESRMSFYEGSVIAEFLNTSQLTYHGLAALHEGLQPGALAVFFRNNHFNVLAKHNDGALYLLVTDQGYLREPHVVWERLSGIDGDTAFCKADFTPYEGKSVTGVILDADAAAAQNHDADLALALQMQEEEERADRARRTAQQQQEQQQQQHQTAEAAAAAGSRGRASPAAAVTSAAPRTGPAGQGRGTRYSLGGTPAGRHSQHTGQAPPKDKKDCVIM